MEPARTEDLLPIDAVEWLDEAILVLLAGLAVSKLDTLRLTALSRRVAVRSGPNGMGLMAHWHIGIRRYTMERKWLHV